ncbi:low molecular weight phosphotyrosine protein phosphatase [Papiliotrema laurentii]|uniref:Low molecular weight phosphotyrosine protein phosphatase n=1 Tax=Papiliotrema laurentii TaxID=5418 RepID=A0AAD9FRN5_PAPLA|nr:low molecular weight phosphotyrosine protein phosphatase [Papiliotrema laurentii]
MAEAVLNHRISQRQDLKGKIDFHVDSAGTGAYHAGDEADDRTIATCRKHKIPISCIARKVTNADFAKFDYIIAMDQSNLQTLLNRQPASSRSHIALFGSFDPALANSYDAKKGRAIDDPYYGGSDGFEKCYQQCIVYADGLLDYIEKHV